MPTYDDLDNFVDDLFNQPIFQAWDEKSYPLPKAQQKAGDSPQETGWEDNGYLGRVAPNGDDGSGIVQYSSGAAEYQSMGLGGIFIGLLLLAAGGLIIMALSEWGLI